ncbi:hypothetical protein ADUPG1_008306, partial [Aduncisulcus paluster]
MEPDVLLNYSPIKVPTVVKRKVISYFSSTDLKKRPASADIRYSSNIVKRPDLQGQNVVIPPTRRYGTGEGSESSSPSGDDSDSFITLPGKTLDKGEIKPISKRFFRTRPLSASHFPLVDVKIDGLIRRKEEKKLAKKLKAHPSQYDLLSHKFSKADSEMKSHHNKVRRFPPSSHEMAQETPLSPDAAVQTRRQIVAQLKREEEEKMRKSTRKKEKRRKKKMLKEKEAQQKELAKELFPSYHHIEESPGEESHTTIQR